MTSQTAAKTEALQPATGTTSAAVPQTSEPCRTERIFTKYCFIAVLLIVCVAGVSVFSPHIKVFAQGRESDGQHFLVRGTAQPNFSSGPGDIDIPQRCNYSWCQSPYRFDQTPASVLSAIELLLNPEAVEDQHQWWAGKPKEIAATGPGGGLGDRVRGVFAVAMIALLSGRRLLVEPNVLLTTRPAPGYSAILDHPNDCAAGMLQTAMGDTQSLRFNTNCIFERSMANNFANKYKPTYSPARAQAISALLSYCTGEFTIGDTTKKNCQDYSGSGCYTVKKPYQCGPMLLHAAMAHSQPDMAALLNSAYRLHHAWQRSMAPKGYNVLQFRTGHSPLRYNENITLPSTPWPDAEWCGARCTSWIRDGDTLAKKHKPTLPVALASDSSVLIGILQAKMWNSLRLLHCCAGAVHVDRGGAMSLEQDMSIVQQTVFDLVLMGHARRLFVDLGHFWTLGLYWWSMNTNTTVMMDRGPAATIPLLV